jgi:hypothetical protein
LASPDFQVVAAGGSISALVPQLVLSRSLDCYLDARSAASVIGALVPGQHMIQLKGRGVRLRCVTEITADNLQYCKDVMKYFDLYHMPALTGNFVIIDGKEYLGYVSRDGGPQQKQQQELPLLIRTQIPSFVASQQFLLENVIKNAVPAQKRILEIAKGSEGEFMETIRDPARVSGLVRDLINSAIYEVSVLFSTKNSFVLAEREGILDALGATSEKGTRVRILVMEDKEVKEISEAKLKVAYKDVRINYLQQFLPTKITTIVVDQNKSIVMEVNDDEKETFQEAIGLVTYSNSESTVFSNTSMFESLWIQSELDKQNKTKQVYFQMFKGFKLKDEVYNRRWSFERKEGEES